MGWVGVVILLFFFSNFAYAGAKTDADEALITSVCRSTAPVLLIDNFAGPKSNTPDIDLNGDTTYDVYHGDFVAKVIEYDGHSIIKAVVGSPVYPADILHILQFYLAQIKSGKVRISRINFSQSFDSDFDWLNAYMGLPVGTISSQNLSAYSDRILQKIWTQHPEEQLQQLYGVLQELQKLGVPMFVAAGNSQYTNFNLYSLFPDVHTVGALDLNGDKAAYSGDNSTVTVWRRGGIPTYAVNGGTGIAIGNHETADFKLQTPVVSPGLLSEFSGKTPEAVFQHIPQKIEDANDDGDATFDQLTAKLPKGLYSTDEVLDHSLSTDMQIAGYMKSDLGDYFYMDGVHPHPLFFLNDDPFTNVLMTKQGVQTPDGRQFRNVIFGTSFAVPSICDGERTPEQYAL